MDTVIIHALWWLFGFACGFVVMGALALSSTIKHLSDEPIVIDIDEPLPVLHIDASLAEAQATARFYQELYLDEMRKPKPA